VSVAGKDPEGVRNRTIASEGDREQTTAAASVSGSSDDDYLSSIALALARRSLAEGDPQPIQWKPDENGNLPYQRPIIPEFPPEWEVILPDDYNEYCENVQAVFWQNVFKLMNNQSEAQRTETTDYFRRLTHPDRNSLEDLLVELYPSLHPEDRFEAFAEAAVNPRRDRTKANPQAGHSSASENEDVPNHPSPELGEKQE
jgi:hypothetical protein